MAPAVLSYLRDPVELVDRAFNKIEDLRDRPVERELGPDGYPSEAEILTTSREWWGYVAEDRFEERLLERLPGASMEGFEPVWLGLRERLDRLGVGLDADERLAAAVWALVRHLRPQRVVETGVSRGVLSSVILEALEGDGHLWSIDLPPRVIGEETRTAVTDRQRERWTYLKGSSRRHLPRLVRRLGTIDIFLHDSQHTARNMAFEMNRAWPHVRSGGVMVVDDIHENGAFATVPEEQRLIAQERTKAGLFGIAFKP